MTRPDLDAITARTKGLVFISDGTRGADKVGALLADVPALVEYVRTLEAAIADAPHDGDCDMLQSPYIRGFARVRECNCWKADYDAAKEAPHE